MVDDNHIDNLFRSALEPFEQSPSEKVWSSLDAELGKRGAAIANGDAAAEDKKKKRRFLFLLLACALVSFGGFEYFSGNLSGTKNQALSTQPQTSPKESGQANTQPQSNSTEAASSKMTITSSNDLVADNSPKPLINVTNKSNEKNLGEAVNSGVTMNGSAPKESLRTVHSSSDKSKVGSSKVASKVKSASSENGKVASNHSAHHSSSAKSSVGNSIQPTIEPKKSNSDLFAKANTNREEKRVEQNSVNNNSSEPSSTTVAETNDATTAASSNSSSESTGNANSEKTNGESANNTSSTETPAQSNSTETAAIQPAAPAVSPAPPQLDAKAPIGNPLTKLTVAAFYAPEMANRYFTNGNSSASQSAGTTSSEKFGSSFNTGVLLRYDISAFGRWSIGVGASYSTLQQITSVTTSYIIPAESGGHQFPGHPSDSSSFTGFSYSSNNNQYTFNTSCGSVHLQTPPGMLSNTSNKADTVKFTTNTTMLLKYINVPLTVRYTPDFLTKGRFSVYADAGVSLSFLVNKQAHVVIDDSYSETSSDISGLRSMYYGWLFGIGAQYQFCHGFSVFAEPSFRGSVSSITDGNSQSFYPYSLGVSTGLSYHF